MSKKITIEAGDLDLAATVELMKKAGVKRMAFPMKTEMLKDYRIEDLELEGRTKNYVRKFADDNGLKTIAELVEWLAPIEKIMESNKNVGKGTAYNLYYKLLEFQYSILPEESKIDFLYRLFAENVKAIDLKGVDYEYVG